MTPLRTNRGQVDAYDFEWCFFPHVTEVFSFCAPADEETSGGEEEASSHQREFAGAADFAGRHRREYGAHTAPALEFHFCSAPQ